MAETEQEDQLEADPLRHWRLAGLIATVFIVLSIPAYLARRQLAGPSLVSDHAPTATFVGRERCVDCHRQEYELWVGSDHDLAMDIASEQTVLGDFDNVEFEDHGITSRFSRRDGEYFVHTEGPGGVMADFEITHTFGFEPLQQYLIPFPGGRLQTLNIAWNTQDQRWFIMYPGERIPPDDWLHWTRNAQNWNGMCAECHSTHLIKGYDAETDTYKTTWSEIDVSCEACHGPASLHVQWADIEPMARPELGDAGLVVSTRDLENTELVELCAPCHSRRTELGDYDHDGKELMQTLAPALLDEGLYHADGQILNEVYVYGSFVQSKMYRNAVGCSDCHDSHSGKLRYEGNDLCLQCHREADYDRYEHHFHKKDFEGEPSAGALCASCHMPQKPFMVIDERADHSLRSPRPDLSLEIGVPNACAQSGCHGGKSLEWMADAYRDWYGKARKPHYGPILAAGRQGSAEAQEKLVRLAADPLVAVIVRATALDLLGRYPGEDSRKAFLQGLQDEAPLVRHTAVEGFAPSSPAELVEILSPLLFDPFRAIRMQTATRLAGIPESELEPYQLEALEKALEDHEEGMRRSLDFAFAGHNLGNLYAQRGDRDRAIENYQKAIAVDDLFFPAKMNLAILYNAEGRNEEAVTLLREVLEADPEQPEAAYSLGLLLAEMQRFEEAITYLEIAARITPEDARVHLNLGLIYQHLGQIESAEESLGKAVGLDPYNLRYLHAFADHLLRSGQLLRSASVAQAMLEIDPHAEVARQILAMAESAMAGQQSP